MNINSLLSMTKAAKAANVCEDTVQRYVKKGILPWRGAARRGRKATGIRLSDLLRVIRGRGKDKRPRDSKRPAWKNIYYKLDGLPYSSEQLVGRLISAIMGGACADLAYFGIYEICRGNHCFAHSLMKNVSIVGMEELHIYAAKKS